ncbi:hypothetical protein GMD78_10840 [Ornithinibacillus sp. L9]|uniref:Glycosyl transferase family 2 n=1 Tax=Ornithinibacillus caprae TaxID=2678566 RepID=A0A6N8FMC1_9BACI|nr:hypothetical protein [Ornithinibacillus caprae]MUK88889.1 hypothetical protein [Ornithinibacillus caprae]
MTNVSLLTVTHDPKGKSISLIKSVQHVLESIYSGLYITVSEESSTELITLLRNSTLHVKIIPKKGAAHARREAVKFGLSSNSGYFHYADFDRILAWASYHEQELKQVVAEISNQDYLIIGRTERAFQTHPVEWVETEKITNKICSLELNQEVDITAGSCAFSKEAANYIDLYSKEKMTDAEWAMIVHRIAGLNVATCKVNGLEYREEVNGVNYSTSTAETWLSRLKLSMIISETACRVGK